MLVQAEEILDNSVAMLSLSSSQTRNPSRKQPST